MTNSLTVITNDISTPEKLAVMRMKSSVPHYRDIPRVRRCTMLADLIMQAYVLKHQSPEIGGMSLGQVVEMDASALDSFIMEDMYISDYTFAEIEEAFRLGLTNRLGEYYGLNSVSFFGFLQNYLNTEKKRKAIKIVQETRKKQKRLQYEKELRERAERQKNGDRMIDVTMEKLLEIGTPKTLLPEENHRDKVRRQARNILNNN